MSSNRFLGSEFLEVPINMKNKNRLIFINNNIVNVLDLSTRMRLYFSLSIIEEYSKFDNSLYW